MIEIRDVTKKYGNLTALDAVSFSFDSNKTHVLLGSSGSGKSTLLRAMLGLISLDHGSIRIGGSLVSRMAPENRAKQFGYVPQDAGLFPHLTCLENVTLVARSLNWNDTEINERLLKLNQVVPLDGDVLNRFPSEISGGQKQRVALLRSLFLDPPIILMDEPFAALDPLVREEIQNEVKLLFLGLQKTVVFITHDVGEAHFFADSITLLHRGKIVQQGQLRDLIERPVNSFVTKFLKAQRVFQITQVIK